MSWLANLFAPAPKPLCVHIPGCYLIDLTPLPADCPRVVRALRQIIERVKLQAEPLQVWVMPAHLVDHYWSEAASTEDVNDLLSQLTAASSSAQPQMILEPEPPPGLAYLLRSCGFSLARPDLKFQLVDAGGKRREVAVMEQLAKIRATPNNGTVVI